MINAVELRCRSHAMYSHVHSRTHGCFVWLWKVASENQAKGVLHAAIIQVFFLLLDYSYSPFERTERVTIHSASLLILGLDSYTTRHYVNMWCRAAPWRHRAPVPFITLLSSLFWHDARNEIYISLSRPSRYIAQLNRMKFSLSFALFFSKFFFFFNLVSRLTRPSTAICYATSFSFSRPCDCAVRVTFFKNHRFFAKVPEDFSFSFFSRLFDAMVNSGKRKEKKTLKRVWKEYRNVTPFHCWYIVCDLHCTRFCDCSSTIRGTLPKSQTMARNFWFRTAARPASFSRLLMPARRRRDESFFRGFCLPCDSYYVEARDVSMCPWWRSRMNT